MKVGKGRGGGGYTSRKLLYIVVQFSVSVNQYPWQCRLNRVTIGCSLRGKHPETVPGGGVWPCLWQILMQWRWADGLQESAPQSRRMFVVWVFAFALLVNVTNNLHLIGPSLPASTSTLSHIFYCLIFPTAHLPRQYFYGFALTRFSCGPPSLLISGIPAQTVLFLA